MLKPFQIKDLHRSPSQSHEDLSGRPSSSRGVVQISAADYDDIASNHPRARLTYLDDDDGDQITVGSSLELSQRLDEQVAIETRLDNFQPSQDELAPMHIFDIRRSNSVTELWRQFEKKNNDSVRSQQVVIDIAAPADPANDEREHKEEPDSNDTITTSPPRDGDQPFMAVFEAELANVLNSADNIGDRAAQPEPSSASVPPFPNTGSQRTPHPLEVIAATFLYHLVNGANSVQSELSSRLPELQDQLRNAQRTVPENVRTSLQSLLATIEAHMRIAFNNLPDNGRQLAEDAINAGRPVAENAADGLRMMASEFNEAGRTLFSAFENEFGRFGLNGSTTTSERPHPTPSPFTGSTSNGPVSPDPTSRDADIHPGDSEMQEKEAADSGPSSAPNPEVGAYTTPPDAKRHQGPPFPPQYPPWQAPWDPVRPTRHHRPPPPRPPGTVGPHNLHGAPPMPPPKETSNIPDSQSEVLEKKALFIGNVGYKVTERMIQDVFASKGFIVSAHLPQDSNTGRHAGFGYIDFPSIHPAIAAIHALQGVHIDGHAINLEFTDDALIESVCPSERPSHAEPSTLYETYTRQELPSESKGSGASALEQKDSGVSVDQSARARRAGRRKSVTFQERDLSSLDLKDTKGKPKEIPVRLQSPPLIDLSTDNPTSQHKSDEVHNHFPTLNPELEMSRFPPVSQLEAQLFANQQQGRAIGTESDATTSQMATGPDLLPEFQSASSYYPAGPGDETSSMIFAGRQKQRGSGGPGLHRSSTMTFTRREGEPLGMPNPTSSDGPSNVNPLRRHATERHSLRRGPRDSTETDTWARLDRRERRRSRRSSYHSIPGSFPVEEAPQPAASGPPDASVKAKESDIDRCVSSLMDMGYGTADDGGRSRMAVYAAASNGSLYDAIEMIEEERKVYARHCRE
ncbi:uncharacterized protein N7482_000707 [Penicillium canariense]|uniref:RRM domain-containing protein n=1 Tax=Penicillium canariense TaxID=189055 RepID=A0A9W9LSW6_9EURO|nr:uncharacterized protein N7482_000707 [Penicillium canariense]KAJ5174830.1 hypothetical protein N7482_000707 [Penicillium canariense]